MTLHDKLDTFRRLVNSLVFDSSRVSFYSSLHDVVSFFNNSSDYCYIDTRNKQYCCSAHFFLADVLEVRNDYDSIIIDVFICYSDTLVSNIYYRVDV
ncbi:MAG: hypothetical protein [Microviridae sp.]|nr:MAG: hypothetical protein [Microviridae sp.]